MNTEVSRQVESSQVAHPCRALVSASGARPSCRQQRHKEMSTRRACGGPERPSSSSRWTRAFANDGATKSARRLRGRGRGRLFRCSSKSPSRASTRHGSSPRHVYLPCSARCPLPTDFCPGLRTGLGRSAGRSNLQKKISVLTLARLCWSTSHLRVLLPQTRARNARCGLILSIRTAGSLPQRIHWCRGSYLAT